MSYLILLGKNVKFKDLETWNKILTIFKLTNANLCIRNYFVGILDCHRRNILSACWILHKSVWVPMMSKIVLVLCISQGISIEVMRQILFLNHYGSLTNISSKFMPPWANLLSVFWNIDIGVYQSKIKKSNHARCGSVWL